MVRQGELLDKLALSCNRLKYRYGYPLDSTNGVHRPEYLVEQTWVVVPSGEMYL